jgi:hypothetical protein
MNNKLISSKILKFAKKIKCINILGGKCKNCGDDNIFHLTFHHLFDKEFEISDVKYCRWSVLEKELLKCELLCENCHAEKHYLDNINNDNRRNSKLIYLKYKGEKCEICGYNECEASLTFHHRNKDKTFWIGSLNERITNITELKNYIIDELNKCEVVCRNCHREKHSDIDFFEKYKQEIYMKLDNYKEIQSKLPREEIINMYISGIKQIDIAKYFNASKGTICDIIKKEKNKINLQK